MTTIRKLPLLFLIFISSVVSSPKQTASNSPNHSLSSTNYPTVNGTWSHIPLTYTNDYNLSQPSVVYSIDFVKNGTAWVGTDNGLWSITGDGEKRYTHKDILLFDQVNPVITDKVGIIWFSYNKWNGWISSWDEKSTVSSYILPGRILAMDTADDGKLWAIYSASEISAPGIAVWDYEKWQQILTDKELFEIPEDRSETSHRYEYSILADTDNSVWIIADKVIAHVTNGGKVVEYPIDLVKCYTKCDLNWRKLVWGKDHTLWGLIGNTVFHYTKGDWINYQFPTTKSQSIGSIDVSSDGTVWSGNGYMKNDQISKIANSPLHEVLTITAAPDGSIWYGTQDGIYIFRRSE